MLPIHHPSCDLNRVFTAFIVIFVCCHSAAVLLLLLLIHLWWLCLKNQFGKIDEKHFMAMFLTWAFAICHFHDGWCCLHSLPLFCFNNPDYRPNKWKRLVGRYGMVRDGGVCENYRINIYQCNKRFSFCPPRHAVPTVHLYGTSIPSYHIFHCITCFVTSSPTLCWWWVNDWLLIWNSTNCCIYHAIRRSAVTAF